ncbi:hypothetical protein GCM10010277_84170 [Streptomyces longisporoflavus]|uniref:NUDIX hydrolase n=1 Tax=Streptomyces longisporoflavus TaxID=28044 RepID=UPI00167C94E3|nr:hypothetical protein GCM10010277_84170 [Streptomyces longisporoflavus]
MQWCRGAVIVHSGRVLLIRRRVPEGDLVWQSPAGMAEPGETAERAAVRNHRMEQSSQRGWTAPLPYSEGSAGDAPLSTIGAPVRGGPPGPPEPDDLLHH